MLRTKKKPSFQGEKKTGNIEKNQNDFGFLNSNTVKVNSTGQCLHNSGKKMISDSEFYYSIGTE